MTLYNLSFQKYLKYMNENFVRGFYEENPFVKMEKKQLRVKTHKLHKKFTEVVYLCIQKLNKSNKNNSFHRVR
jgi:hypothetical protein